MQNVFNVLTSAATLVGVTLCLTLGDVFLAYHEQGVALQLCPVALANP